MLQGRLFSYGDAQRYRLGVNHAAIPVNSARCPVHSSHRDGQMRVDGNHGALAPYAPNSQDEWLAQPDFAEPPSRIGKGASARWNHRVDQDYFSQPGDLFRLMTSQQQALLFENTGRALQGVRRDIQDRHIHHCGLADPLYGAGVSAVLSR